MVDSYTPSMPGGTGVAVDLSVFKNVQQESTLPVILAGGLTPDNIFEVIQKVHPYAVDVLTSVEERPDHKDTEKIQRFTQSAQATEYMEILR